ncbi:alpha/beta hydrolase [Nocardia otitidiscaviarum]|uniref:alpha/beta fold hydrolase n=1 Tax=Nocardia otitidiscaviarum TaxID=1823 RepID=UPI0006936E82|nr:alpha/beta hydrolase [Nocardia otitidiscaviarum]MBF6132093.1 alpha/beta hydrolase [Nocardia otitidiscaviarum]MBF6483223.1 alpha/beta hydrolase [Nocardia otitidiscaviarum]
MAAPQQNSGALAPGGHAFGSDGVVQRYHVYGNGPVCLAHPGGPGIHWEYLRMPELEESLTMVYVEALGTGESGRLPTHPNGYTRERYSLALQRIIDHIGVPKVYLLGHSHGAFVAAYHAIHRPAGLAGIVLYEGAPVTGPEHGAEAGRRLQEFAAAHADQSGLNDVLAAFVGMQDISSDEQTLAIARGILPSYIADYWRDEQRWAPLRDAVRASFISGLDVLGSPDLIDDRADLPKMAVPALIIVGLFDVICGPRWARELHDLIPDSRLVMLENSGHLGHLEEPERFTDAVRAFVLSTQSLPSPSDGSTERLMRCSDSISNNT